MRIIEIIRSRLSEFQNICVSHKVETLYAFGSSISKNFNPKTSDIDLIVEIDVPDPLERGEMLIELWDTFEHFFGKKVDLLTTSSIKNPILKSNIEETKILLYDRAGQKVFV